MNIPNLEELDSVVLVAVIVSDINTMSPKCLQDIQLCEEILPSCLSSVNVRYDLPLFL